LIFVKISIGCLVVGGIAGALGFTGMASEWSGWLKGVLIVASFAALCASAYDIARVTPLEHNKASEDQITERNRTC
jgi:hypothetical protein